MAPTFSFRQVGWVGGLAFDSSIFPFGKQTNINQIKDTYSMLSENAIEFRQMIESH